METLDGRVAVITGGASGIGRAMAERFAAEGMNLVLADIEQDALDRATAELWDKTEVLGVRADVTDPAAVAHVAHAARHRFGGYHVVCNNAGVIGHFARTWELPLADYRWVLEVNVIGVINGITQLVPALVAQDEGHVVNTASLAAWTAAPSMGAYNTSKHAVYGLSETLRLELEAAGSKVGVSAVCPGIIRSNLMGAARNWPAHMGERPGADGGDAVSSVVREVLRQGLEETGVEASAVADAVVEGILANRFVITTHPDDVAAAADQRARVARGEAPAMAALSPPAGGRS